MHFWVDPIKTFGNFHTLAARHVEFRSTAAWSGVCQLTAPKLKADHDFVLSAVARNYAAIRYVPRS